MVIDTGAIGMTVTETVANWLVSNGQATNAPSEKKALADGSPREFRSIDINTLNIAGREIHKVRAGCRPGRNEHAARPADPRAADDEGRHRPPQCQAEALSEQILGLSPAVLASAHEQSVPIF
jgi:hypothetical protein